MIIKTKDDWWKLYEQNIDNTMGYQQMIYDIPEATKDQMLQWLHKRDWQAATKFLDQVWIDAPDSPVIHTWPGWHDLCDLCSESWVFHEDALDV
jgi:hypothetical protein